MLNPFTEQKITSKKTMKQLLLLYTKHYLHLQKGGNEKSKSSEQNNICPICLQKIYKQNGGSIRESLQCNHLFHKECLKKWGENKPCSYCNQQSAIYMDYQE